MCPGVRKSILIVDDEKDILESLAGFLRRNGYGVFTADTGSEGLMLAKKELPSLIILDLILPDIDGTDIAVELVQNPLTHSIPIIFLTSVLKKDEQLASGEIIANRCIVAKPCKSEEILGLIKDRIGTAY